MLARANAADNQARAILEKSVAITGSLRGSSYVMKGFERQRGKLIILEVLTKVNVAPNKIYTKVLSDPNKGTELLFVKGQNSDKVRVNPRKVFTHFITFTIQQYADERSTPYLIEFRV
jgi:hypothetical protein